MGLTLTILFDDPFWVGLFESLDHDRLEIARVVFGSEPSDALVWEFVRERFGQVRFVGTSARQASGDGRATPSGRSGKRRGPCRHEA